MTAIRIVIADDQALMRAGFRMILEAQPDIVVVGEAGNGREAVRAVAQHHPDLVLMDIRMPVMDGIEATALITDTPVIVLTTFHEDEYVVGALRAGARGFLLKDARPAELVGAVRAVHRGDALLSPQVTRALLDRLMPRMVAGAGGQTEADPGERLSVLTDREREVLRLIAHGLSNAEIAEHLTVSEATVKTHVSHVLGKLGIRDRVQAVIAAYDAQLVTPTDH